MLSINEIIQEEIMNTVANYPEFGERLHNLDEYGEGSITPYPFKFQNISFGLVEYHFDTPEDEYIVTIVMTSTAKRIWTMEFGVAGGTPEDVINKGHRDSVMSTMIAISNDFLNKYKPNALTFKPEKTKGDNDMRRFNMYMIFIKKNMRNDYLVYERNPYIVIERKVPIFDKNAVTV